MLDGTGAGPSGPAPIACTACASVGDYVPVAWNPRVRRWYHALEDLLGRVDIDTLGAIATRIVRMPHHAAPYRVVDP